MYPVFICRGSRLQGPPGDAQVLPGGPEPWHIVQQCATYNARRFTYRVTWASHVIGWSRLQAGYVSEGNFNRLRSMKSSWSSSYDTIKYSVKMRQILQVPGLISTWAICLWVSRVTHCPRTTLYIYNYIYIYIYLLFHTLPPLDM